MKLFEGKFVPSVNVNNFHHTFVKLPKMSHLLQPLFTTSHFTFAIV